MKKYFINSLLTLSLFGLLSSCSSPEPEKPLEKYDVVEVKLLVAPWCEPCRAELPRFSASMEYYDKKRILLSAVLQTGITPQSQPTEAISFEMKKTSGAYFDFYQDEKPWMTYKKHFASGAKYLPATVVIAMVDKCEGEVCTTEEVQLKTYQGSVQPEEILNYAKGRLK